MQGKSPYADDGRYRMYGLPAYVIDAKDVKVMLELMNFWKLPVLQWIQKWWLLS